MIWLEPQILMLKQINSVDQQPAADKKKERQGNLAGNKHSSQAAMRSSSRRCATFGLQNRVDVTSRCSECGSEAAQHRGKKRHSEREQQNVAVESHWDGANGFVESHFCSNKVNAPPCEHQRHGAAKQSIQQAFGQQLPNNTEPAGAQSDADT